MKWCKYCPWEQCFGDCEKCQDPYENQDENNPFYDEDFIRDYYNERED